MKLKPHDPKHPYVRRLVGCGHGVRFKDYCRDCEIVGLLDVYKRAVNTAKSAKEKLRQLGIDV